MPNTINKSTDFAGQPFFIGIDIHKKSWTVTIRTLEIEVGHFIQEPNAGHLSRYLYNRYPGGKFSAHMEQGFVAFHRIMHFAKQVLRTLSSIQPIYHKQISEGIIKQICMTAELLHGIWKQEFYPASISCLLINRNADLYSGTVKPK